jgi:hypothetical protein
MKLQTSIRPRRDGTVVVSGEDGQKHAFKMDETGVLVCDVPDEATVARLLAIGEFEPVDPADYEQAMALSESAWNAGLANRADGADAAGDDDGPDDDFTEEVVPGGLPLEANTPPAPPKAPKAPKTAAKAVTQPAKKAAAKK